MRLDLNGNMLDKIVINFSDDFLSNFNKARFNQTNIDTLQLKNYFFSNDFHNALLNVYDMQNNYYLKRLSETRNQLIAIKDLLSNQQQILK